LLGYKIMRIIETDNFDGDYPNEKFLALPSLSEDHAQVVVNAINSGFPENHDRYYRVVPNDYELVPGFEP
jgi:hypothetical protein